MYYKFIPLILFSVLLNAGAQLFLRKGMAGRTLTLRQDAVTVIQDTARIVFDPWIVAALTCYAVSIVAWMAVLSKVHVSYAYPFLSVGYVVVVAAAYFLFREPVGAAKLVGITLICIGVVLVARGA